LIDIPFLKYPDREQINRSMRSKFSPEVFRHSIPAGQSGTSITEVTLITGVTAAVIYLSLFLLGDANKGIFENAYLLMKRASQTLLQALGG